jgi:hypothetical protein
MGGGIALFARAAAALAEGAPGDKSTFASAIEPDP